MEKPAAVDESEDEIDVPEEVENSFEILFEGLQDEVWIALHDQDL